MTLIPLRKRIRRALKWHSIKRLFTLKMKNGNTRAENYQVEIAILKDKLRCANIKLQELTGKKVGLG